MNELQIAKEVLLSVIKWFLLFIVFNNLLWACVHFVGTSSISNDLIQDGSYNSQEVANGK